MKTTCAWLIVLLILCPLAALGQSPDAEETTPEAVRGPAHRTPAGPTYDPVYFGGSVTLGFGDFTRIGVWPLIGYRVSPKFSIGAKLAYEYINDKRYSTSYESHNYGGSAFGRYFVVPQIYAHAEYAYMSYDFLTSPLESERQWVPFLLLGGGYRAPISPRAAAYVEVLFDVLQDENSPYKSGEPRFSAGIAVGF